MLFYQQPAPDKQLNSDFKVINKPTSVCYIESFVKCLNAEISM
jgi:hypothetical protein